MRDEDVLNRLESLGAAPPPPPSAGFLDDLSQRLLEPDLEVPRASHRHGAHRRPLFARPEVLTPILSAVAASVVTALLVSRGGDTGTQTVEMIRASGEVEVVLPDGKVVAGLPGLEVPDGSLIRVHGQGEAEVNGVVVGSNQSAEVVNGGVQPTGVPIPTTTPTTAAPRPTTTTTARPRPRPTPTTAAPATTTTTTPDESSTSTTETTAPAQPQPMRGSAVVNRNGGVVIRWSGYSEADFGAYVVVRATDGNRPDGPNQPGNEVVFRSPDQGQLFFIDHPDPASRPLYRVVALDTARRKVVAATFVLRPQPPVS